MTVVDGEPGLRATTPRPTTPFANPWPVCWPPTGASAAVSSMAAPMA